MSTIKVNTITKRTGSTLTLGESGTTVTLACGATQTGFGRTGTVNWCTTAKTSPFTATSGSGFFVNTTSGVVTVTLPASPSAGDIVSIADYTNTFQTNNTTVAGNGSKIGGICSDAILNTEGQSVTFVYVDGTEGWKNVQDSTSNVTGNPFLIATGGTITTDGNFKIHTFTGDGTFTVSSAAVCAANNAVAYMVVAGGAGGGGDHGGGGGAGGFREGTTAPVVPYTASPLVAPAGITVSAQAYPITVGGGGSAGGGQTPSAQGTKGGSGSNSIFSTITSAGGGGGAKENSPGTVSPPSPNDGIGIPGGSGGGSSYSKAPSPWIAGGSGNTPPVSPPQGNNGGSAPSGTPSPVNSSSGGGGATAAGGAANPSGNGGAGGAGASSSITGSAIARSGGGGGAGGASTSGGAGGTGGGGAGNSPGNGTAGTTNTGGGGGGGYPDTFAGGAGGSGIVILRYRFQ